MYPFRICPRCQADSQREALARSSVIPEQGEHGRPPNPAQTEISYIAQLVERKFENSREVIYQ